MSSLTFLGIALGLLFCFLLATAAVSHLQLSARQQRWDEAHLLAESAVARTLERLMYDRSFGSKGSETVEVDGPNASEGWVSFATQQLEYSTWNLSTPR